MRIIPLQNVMLGVLLAGITLAVYWPVGGLDFISYDDPDYLLNNPAVQNGINGETIWWALTTTQAANWHPVTWLSHTLDWQVFGRNPGAFHLENLAWHIANTLLLFIVLRKMTGATWRSALVAALFAWHPAHIQSVAWISERKDMLSGFFMLLTLWAYTCHAQNPKVRNPAADAGLVTTQAYWLAVVCFALGLMSKPMLVTLPAILLLADVWPLERISAGMMADFGFIKILRLPAGRQLLWEKIPFVLLSLASVAVTLLAQSGAGFVIATEVLPMTTRLANVPVFCAAYLEKLFWPADLAIFYPYQAIPFWEKAGAGLLLIVLTVIAWRQMRTRPWWVAGWLWFLIMLVPVIGIVQVGAQAIADRYTYLPSIGIFCIVAWGLGGLATVSRGWRTGVCLGAAAWLLGCLADTRYQLRYWRDDITLARHATEVTKNNFSCYFGLGNALMAQGDYDGAADSFKAALAAAAAYPWKVDTYGAHHNFGGVLLYQNHPAEAEQQFRVALQVSPQNPFTHKYLGDALLYQGKSVEAETEYGTAQQLMPGNPGLSQQIEASKTLASLLARVKAEPTPELLVKVAELEAGQGKYRDAVDHYTAALQARSDAAEILNNLAWLLATCPQEKIRDGGRAVALAQHACELTQFQKTVFLGTLGAAYAEAGKFDEAIATAQRACDLAAKNGEAELLQANQVLLKLYQRHQTGHNAPQ